jgi:hypothetical protein
MVNSVGFFGEECDELLALELQCLDPGEIDAFLMLLSLSQRTTSVPAPHEPSGPVPLAAHLLHDLGHRNAVLPLQLAPSPCPRAARQLRP